MTRTLPENPDVAASNRRRNWRWFGRPPSALGHLALLAVARLGISAAVSALGYVALSDDDYARVTIAQNFAVAPRLDPSGTSWLPFPFWITGGAMRLLDPSLDVARATGAALAIGATWLLFAAGRWWGFSPERAFVAALLANVVPSAALLGSLTTPEFFAAALGVFAIVAVTSSAGAAPSAGRGVAIGAAILAATLSRYEAWPVAAVVAVYAGFARRDAPLRWRAGVAAAALAGPIFWIADNRMVHGDAFSFLHRVASYRAALGVSPRSGTMAALLIAFALAALYALLRALRGAVRREETVTFAAWGGAALALFSFLAVGDFIGGAPTHHTERTLLFAWLLGVFTTVHFAGGSSRWRAWWATAFAVFIASDAFIQFSHPGINRADEELVGTELRSLVGQGERVYVATNDYGYFAVEAAFGRPLDTVIDATHDPRKKSEPSILKDRSQVLDRLHAERALWLVAPSSAFLPFALTFRASVGDLSIFERDRHAR